MTYSIITINYNNKEGLRKTIESVINQTYKDFEYIIIDGSSTDGSVDIIHHYSNNINYWVSEKDNGIYHAMNKGTKQAQGEYCLFMNSGDCFYDNNVLKIVAEQDCKEDIYVGKVFSQKDGQIISPPPSREISFYHLYSGAIPHQGAFIKTRLLRKYPYDETLKISSDWKFFLQTIIIDNCTFKYIDSFITKYDLEGISSSNPEKMRHEKEQVLAEIFPARVLADYRFMKASECLTQTLTPQLRIRYSIDRLLFRLGSLLLKIL